MAYRYYSDDPVADAEAWQAELDAEEREFIEASPVCECCGRPVAEADGGTCYWLFGSWFCIDCIEKGRRDVPDGR